MGVLLTLGVSHKTAPIEIREKLAFAQEHVPHALKALAEETALEEIALLSTCNRTELYCVSNAQNTFPMQAVISWWRAYQMPAFDISPYLYSLSNQCAVKHIMRVASGLDSMVIGEPQILGQLKKAFYTATQSGVLGKRLSRLFQTSFSVAKKIRTQTKIGTYPVSIAFAAVVLAKQIFSDLSKAKVVLIGAGENTERVLQHLVSKGVHHLMIVNRTVGHAKALGERYGAKVYPLDNLIDVMSVADIVVSSISTPFPIVTQTEIAHLFKKGKRRPILMIDLGVPRNIASDISSHEDIYLYTVDDLQGIIRQNQQERQRAALIAEKVILHASGTYMDWMQTEKAFKVIRTLRNKAENIKNETLALALQELQNGQDPKVLLPRVIHQLTQKLIHDPTVGLRKMGQENAEMKIAIAKELLNIIE